MGIFLKGRRHPSGREVEVEYKGGSKIVVTRFPITFDIPGLVLEGIKLYKPTIGEIFALEYSSFAISITTPWDGTTPYLHSGVLGNLTAYDSILTGTTALTNPNGETVEGLQTLSRAYSQAESFIAVSTDPIMLMVDDGSGGDPGSTQGEGEVIVVSYPSS